MMRRLSLQSKVKTNFVRSHISAAQIIVYFADMLGDGVKTNPDDSSGQSGAYYSENVEQ